MKTTKYFEFRKTFPDRIAIKMEWIVEALSNPLRKEIQSDGRVRVWGEVKEANGKILRVVVLADGETIHNAFFDRDFKKENNL